MIWWKERRMSKKQQKIDVFVNYVRKYCKKANIRLEFRRGAWLYTDERHKADGFFQEPENSIHGRIVIAKGVPDKEWLTTLGHEFGHVLQWMEDSPLYHDKNDYHAERDAERRSRKLMKDFNLPVPNIWHRKQSRNYLTWYKRHRRKP